MKIRLIILSMLLTAFTAFGAPQASETFLLWPGTPPGAEDRDAAKAKAMAKAVEEGTYKIPNRNRAGTRVPTCDVYLPPKDKATGAAHALRSRERSSRKQEYC